MCFLSVIIPVYNVEIYLNRCIESVISQKGFDDVEVLLIDDGSTDSSGDISDEYAKRYDNVLTFHKKNGGLSDARNYGLKYAKGEYVFFLDSDDSITDTFFEDIRQIIYLNKPEMICFKCCYEKEKDKFKLSGNKKVSIESKNKILDDLLKNKMGNQICFNIYLQDLFKEITFPVGRAYEDIATLYKLILCSNKIAKVNYTYYVYNVLNIKSITKMTNYSYMNDMFWAINEQCEDVERYYIRKSLDDVYLTYYKIDKYIYIFIKLYRETEQSKNVEELKSQIRKWLRKQKRINIFKFRHYNIKKYLFYVVVNFIDKIKQ